MQTINLKHLIGLALTLGVSSTALAVPQFQVDPELDGVDGDEFYATAISGISSERLAIDAVGNTLNGSGYVSFTGFNNDGPAGDIGTVLGSGVNNDYQLYLTFDLESALTSGSVGQPGSEYALTALTFTVYMDRTGTLDTTFLPATLGNDATVTDVNGDDEELGSGSLLFGVAEITALGGVALNATTTYANTALGDLFFFDPSPFYSLAFAAFNNTSQGVFINGDFVAITSASGVVDFNQVPEPTSLALLGLGILAVGGAASLRQRRKAC